MQINLVWTGPHSYEEVRHMREASDYGIYQIYGVHPVYGDTLVYIGKANGETFGERFSQPDYRWIENDFADNVPTRFHVGRIYAKTNSKHPEDDTEWEAWIDSAEKLLISTHSPAWNSQNVGGLKKSDTDLYKDYHVLNWGRYGRLLPEVSGARHTWVVWNTLAEDPLRME